MKYHKILDKILGQKTKVKIINMKNLVEYEDRLFMEKETSEILKRTERYFNWIKKQLPSLL